MARPALIGIARAALVQRLASASATGGAPAPTPTPTPSAAITSVTIMDATILDPDGGGLGINGNGWVAKVVMPYIPGATFDPTKLTFVTTDPGFTPTKAATTRNRTLLAGKNLRRQRPNDTVLQVTNDGTTLTAYFGIEDDIYQGTLAVACTAAAGFYGAAQAGPVATVINNSTLPFPELFAAWVTLPGTLVRAATFYPEFDAAGQHTMNGQQVACVEFIATDGTNSTPAVLTSDTSLSDVITGPHRPEVHKPAIPMANLTQGAACTLNAKIYPWIGNAPFDLAVNGVNGATNINCDRVLTFRCDKNGTYGGAYAYFKSGASGGTVSLNPATARAAPFPTLQAAIAAAVTWNNTASAGHSDLHADHGGSTFYGMDDGAGGNVEHVIGSMGGGGSSTTRSRVAVDPLATGAVSLVLNANQGTPNLMHWDIPIRQNGNFGLTGGGTTNNIVAIFSGQLNCGNSTVPINYQIGQTYYLNMPTPINVTGNGNPFKPTYVAQRTQVAAILGGQIIGAGFTGISAAYIAGLDAQKITIDEVLASYTNNDAIDRQFLHNVMLRDSRNPQSFGTQRAITKGLKFWNVVIEPANKTATTALQIAADGTTYAVDNLDLEYVTIPGTTVECRLNIDYTDVAGAVGKEKRFRMKHCIIGPYNQKSDTFETNTTLTGRAGNHSGVYGRGRRGNVTTAPATSGDVSPGAKGPQGNWLGEYWFPSNKVGNASVTYTDMKAGGSTATGLGTYSLTGATNDAYDRVAAGEAGGKYDIVGNLRLNDGHGAAGAYERTV